MPTPDIEEGNTSDEQYRKGPTNNREGGSFLTSCSVIAVTQKVIAEAIGTYFLVFIGCGALTVDAIYGKITFPGVCIAWGLIVMIMVYALGHVSGAHFNPAVTITFAIFTHFPYKKVPFYILAQLLGAVLASGTLCLMFDVDEESYFGTVPTGSNVQSLVMEFIASFLLMFVISGVATDNRSVGELAGIAIGMSILVDLIVAGPVSGASMNPARSIGPALVMQKFDGLWVYVVGPIAGAIAGGFAYNLMKFTENSIVELTKAPSQFIRNASRNVFQG